MAPVRTALRVLAVVAVMAATADSAAWRHGWDQALDMQFIDFGHQELNDTQLAFITKHYRIFSMEKCTGQPTELSVWAMAKKLKALDPTFHPVFYWDVSQIALHCYAAHDTFMAHPEWWLRDDDGHLVNISALQPILDYTNAEARAWWVNVPLGGPDAPHADIVDGILADQFRVAPVPCSFESANFSEARCQAVFAARNQMLAEVQALFKAKTHGRGQIIGNGLHHYTGWPDYNLGSLAFTDGIMNEHMGVFEDVQRNGKLNVTKMHEVIGSIRTAAKQDKTVIVATWPGLFDGFKNGNPSWPNGTQPTTKAGWRDALLQWHTFALAEFLTVVETNVFQQYQVWYSSTEGALQCPNDPGSCMGPDPWYPDLYKPLGAPLGPAQQSGDVYTRRFQHATVTLDLGAPSSSRVAFH